MRALLAATVLTALCASAAHAGVITVSVTDDGSAVPLVCAGGVNSPINCSGGSANFASINVGAAGVSGADLASITIDATAASGGTHVLGIGALQTGLAFATNGSATSTFTINHLTGSPFGPATLSTSVNGALLASHTFPAGTTVDTVLSIDAVPALIASDAHSYAITFTGAGQAATDTIQLVVGTGVPEPAGLALLGSGLLGLGLVRRPPTRDNSTYRA